MLLAGEQVEMGRKEREGKQTAVAKNPTNNPILSKLFPVSAKDSHSMNKIDFEPRALHQFSSTLNYQQCSMISSESLSRPC